MLISSGTRASRGSGPPCARGRGPSRPRACAGSASERPEGTSRAARQVAARPRVGARGVAAGGRRRRRAPCPPARSRAKLSRASEAAGRDPGLGRVLVAGRRLLQVERHAHLRDPARELAGVGRPCAPEARTALTTNSSGVFTFAARLAGAWNSARRHDRAHDRADVAVRLAEDLRGALDESRRRLVGHEASGELPGRRSARSAGCVASRWRIRSRLRPCRRPRSGARARACPRGRGRARRRRTPAAGRAGRGSSSREAAGHLGHVLLGVAAVDAEGVQLHELAGVVLVEAAAAALRLRRAIGERPGCASSRPRGRRAPERPPGARRPRRGRPRASCRGRRAWPGSRRWPSSRSSNFPQAWGADRLALVLADQEAVLALVRVHVEVVHPEVDQHLVELALAVDRAQDLGRLQLVHHVPRRCPPSRRGTSPGARDAPGARPLRWGCRPSPPSSSRSPGEPRAESRSPSSARRSRVRRSGAPRAAAPSPSSAMPSGWSCRSIHASRPILRTDSTSPGRGP